MEHKITRELERVSNQLQQYPKTAQELTSYSSKYKPNTQLTREEQEIQKVQDADFPVQFIREEEFKIKSGALLYTIHVITGWKMPEEQAHLSILRTQFEKKILEEYGSLNTQEIEYAFRSIGAGIEDYGKVFNLNLMDKVLQPYIHRRAQVREFASKQRQELPEYVSYTPADWKENCEQCYQDFIAGQVNIQSWPWQLYDEFVRSGMMEDVFYKNLIGNAKVRLIGAIGGQKIKAETMGQAVNAAELQARLEAISNGTSPEVEYMAKRMSVLYLYQQAKKAGMQNLFVKDWL